MEVCSLSSGVMLRALNPYPFHYKNGLRLLHLPLPAALWPCLTVWFPLQEDNRLGYPLGVVPCRYPCALGSVSTPRLEGNRLTSLRWTSSERPILTLYPFGPGISPAFTCYS